MGKNFKNPIMQTLFKSRLGAGVMLGIDPESLTQVAAWAGAVLVVLAGLHLAQKLLPSVLWKLYELFI